MSRPIPPTLAERKTPGERLGYAVADAFGLRGDMHWLVENNARVFFQPDGTASVTIGGFSRRRPTLAQAVAELRTAISESARSNGRPTTHNKEPT